MEQLALHIEYLLLRHDCVIVPGFGAFINARKAARYDAAESRWYPMKREVRFNKAVNHDDGLLANSYSRKCSLPFHEARILLNSDIRRMKSLLEEDGEVSLGKLGTIFLGEENTLLFTPVATPDQMGREMGLISVATTAATTVSKKEPSKNPTDQMYGFNPEKNYYIPVNKTIAKMAASLMAVMIVAIMSVLPSSRRTAEDRASVLPVVEILDTASREKIESEISGQNKDDEHALSESDIQSESDIISDSESCIREKSFFLIVGTFRSESEADNFIRSRGDDSYNLISVPSKTLFRVAAMASDNKSELVTELNSEKFRSSYPEGWIWENK
ncbi:MAG: hypothetical protein K2O56_07455 [Muribaculaceae bacterium]|nr:hypothetical protein [Muribaculaceae bacterium]